MFLGRLVMFLLKVVSAMLLVSLLLFRLWLSCRLLVSDLVNRCGIWVMYAYWGGMKNVVWLLMGWLF